MPSGQPLPFDVPLGAPGYINLLDALNAWQLVRELRQSPGLAAAASFKHVSRPGRWWPCPLRRGAGRLLCRGPDLSPQAMAYVRPAGPTASSFGDWAALSDTCDEATARIIRREVSDG